MDLQGANHNQKKVYRVDKINKIYYGVFNSKICSKNVHSKFKTQLWSMCVSVKMEFPPRLELSSFEATRSHFFNRNKHAKG